MYVELHVDDTMKLGFELLESWASMHMVKKNLCHLNSSSCENGVFGSPKLFMATFLVSPHFYMHWCTY